MPWSPKQHRYFEAVAHGMATKKGGPSQEEAAKMASEGIKDAPAPRKRQRRNSMKRATVTSYRG